MAYMKRWAAEVQGRLRTGTPISTIVSEMMEQYRKDFPNATQDEQDEAEANFITMCSDAKYAPEFRQY